MDSHNARPAFEIHLVSSIDSPEFTLLTHTLTRSHLIALDAEWKPLQTPDQHSSFPRVSLLQIACQFHSDHRNDSVAFLLDLLSVPLSSIWHLLRDVFVSPYVLKLGFRFKQDLVYLSTTFSSYGGGGVSGLDRIEPFMDIASIYYHLQHKQKGRKLHEQSKSLAAICSEVLGFSLSKVIETFDLKISEDQLMSRCTKCNGRFIQKSLTTEEAVQAAKGFQKIPNCLFDQNLEFWQCMDCHQLYWEGIQYRNAVQKFIDVCKLND